MAGKLFAVLRDVLLIVRAESEAKVEAQLAQDRWTVNGLMRTLWIRPW